MIYFQIKTLSVEILSTTHTNVLQKTLLGANSEWEVLFLKRVFDLVCDVIKQNIKEEKKRRKRKEKLKALKKKRRRKKS